MEELTSDPESVIPRDWVADHGAVRRLLREEGEGTGGEGGGGEVVAEDAWATRLEEILKRGFELESLLLSVRDIDCIFAFFAFFWWEESSQANTMQDRYFLREAMMSIFFFFVDYKLIISFNKFSCLINLIIFIVL